DVADKTLSLIEKLRKERNLSILFTSHNMDEITRICDQVIFLDKGKIVAQDTRGNLTKQINKVSLEIYINGNPQSIISILDQKKLKYHFNDGNKFTIHVQENEIAPTIVEITAQNIQITDVEINKPDLEDVFLHLARKEQE
ncbi:MAG: DUF4162 domain-containing protein, partial [bacterium]|nr:DUF4162 domain-containing protein [bacterium]